MWIYVGYVYIYNCPRPDSASMGLVTMSTWTVLTVLVRIYKQEVTMIKCLINNRPILKKSHLLIFKCCLVQHRLEDKI